MNWDKKHELDDPVEYQDCGCKIGQCCLSENQCTNRTNKKPKPYLYELKTKQLIIQFPEDEK